MIPEFARLIPRFEPFINRELFDARLADGWRIWRQIEGSIELERHVETSYLAYAQLDIDEFIAPPLMLPD